MTFRRLQKLLLMLECSQVLRWGQNGRVYVLKRGLKGGGFGVETVAKMDLIMYNQQLEAIKRELTQVGAPIFGQVKDETTTKSQDRHARKKVNAAEALEQKKQNVEKGQIRPEL
ncbi:hypothetical protein Tco_0324362 [Tanacetum coccineum]